MCVTKSLCHMPETNTILYISYTLIKILNLRLPWWLMCVYYVTLVASNSVQPHGL